MKRSKLWGVGLFAFAFILFGPRAKADTPAHERDVVVTQPAGAPVRLRAAVSGDGPPILFLHGLGASGYAFRHLARDLARTHRVIRLDLKGFGRSDKPFDDAYRPSDQAALVAAFLRQERLAGVTLVGHSYGGAVALLTALALEREAAWRIKRMVLLNTPAFRQDLPGTQRLLALPVIPYVALAVVPPLLNARAALQTRRRASPLPTDGDAIAYAEPIYEAAGRHALIATVRAISETDTRAYERQYGRIRQPTLLIWCRHDPTVPLANGERLEASLPRARLAVLDQCEHMPHEEQPVETLALLRTFLSGR